jgi:hypothetical protein
VLLKSSSNWTLGNSSGGLGAAVTHQLLRQKLISRWAKINLSMLKKGKGERGKVKENAFFLSPFS